MSEAMVDHGEPVGTWVCVHGVFTPGGDPLYVCPLCGGGQHVNGVEHPEHLDRCPACGARLAYPGEARP